MKKWHRILAVIAAFCLGWGIYTVFDSISDNIIDTASQAEQTKPEPPDPEPLVINTVERQDDIVLTVMRGEETVLRYEGNIELWKGSDGKAYGIIYMDGEEVMQ